MGGRNSEGLLGCAWQHLSGTSCKKLRTHLTNQRERFELTSERSHKFWSSGTCSFAASGCSLTQVARNVTKMSCDARSSVTALSRVRELRDAAITFRVAHASAKFHGMTAVPSIARHAPRARSSAAQPRAAGRHRNARRAARAGAARLAGAASRRRAHAGVPVDRHRRPATPRHQSGRRAATQRRAGRRAEVDARLGRTPASTCCSTSIRSWPTRCTCGC